MLESVARRELLPNRRVPRHVGFIPDGNRRWALAHGLAKHDGYAAGIEPGVRLVEACRSIGIAEISIYGFTLENTRRPRVQVAAFRDACVTFARRVQAAGAALRVVGDARSRHFPDELRPLTETRARGDVRVNLLVNYGWAWDLACAERDAQHRLGSHDVSRVDIVVRWGGKSRLSGFLPIQCAYADVHVIDALWPDMQPEQFDAALAWYAEQDVTLGG